MMSRKRRKYLYIIGGFFLVFYILPNVINFRERRFFSDNNRLDHARELTKQKRDSVSVIPGGYYDRSQLYTYFFGEKNRELWTIPATVKVFNYDTINGGLTPYEVGGSQQTISIRVRDRTGKNWSLRSVNKDQMNVLPWWLRASLLRPVFRDQVSAMNPYGAKVVASLAATVGLPHTNPEMYWMPYVEHHKKYNERIAGRLVYLEQHLDSSWTNTPAFFNATELIETDEMEEKHGSGKIAIDTFLYLKTRLFDMLINDWDRHEGQWIWALTENGGRKMFHPIAKDRDIAFYVFDEGIINQLALQANEKFQSFRKEFGNIKGLMHQSKKLDKQILAGIPKQNFIAMAEEMKRSLSDASIRSAFNQYPPAVYAKFGQLHESILTNRLTQLPTVAETFHSLVNED